MRTHILKYCLHCIFIFLAGGLIAFAQTETETRQNKVLQEAYGLPDPILPPDEYSNAEQLAADAVETLRLGNIRSADSLLRESVDIYPTMAFFNYVREIYRLHDIKNATALNQLILAKVAALPGKSVVLPDSNLIATENGIKVRKLRPIEKNRALFLFASEIVKLDQEFSPAFHQTMSLRQAMEIQFDPLGKTAIDVPSLTQFLFEVKYHIMYGDYDVALHTVHDRNESASITSDRKKLAMADIYFDMEDFEKMFEVLKQISTLYSTEITNYQFMANSILGKTGHALSDYDKLTRRRPVLITDNLYLAMIDIQVKDLDAAIFKLTSILNNAQDSQETGIPVSEKYKYYKLLGDAYTGLMQYDKAADYYNISLLSAPGYEPTLTAVVALQELKEKAKSPDSNAPAITIIEPATARGLTVVAADAEILVRGRVIDASGTQSVTANDLPMYIGREEFWGSVPIKDGANKITVTATDFAGNRNSYSFEFIKDSTSVHAKNPIKLEGRNFCLLIAAQDYDEGGIPSLKNPIENAMMLKKLLQQKYGFEPNDVFTLFNATKNLVRSQLIELRNIVGPKDNLLIIYTGQGMMEEELGYWILPTENIYDYQTALSNMEVAALVAEIHSRHTLLISDAVFSGNAVRLKPAAKKNGTAWQPAQQKISRIALTSGAADTLYEDSHFIEYITTILDENDEPYITARSVFERMVQQSTSDGIDIEPQYGTLEKMGHVNGDFIFLRN